MATASSSSRVRRTTAMRRSNCEKPDCARSAIVHPSLDGRSVGRQDRHPQPRSGPGPASEGTARGAGHATLSAMVAGQPDQPRGSISTEVRPRTARSAAPRSCPSAPSSRSARPATRTPASLPARSIEAGVTVTRLDGTARRPGGRGRSVPGGPRAVRSRGVDRRPRPHARRSDPRGDRGGLW